MKKIVLALKLVVLLYVLLLIIVYAGQRFIVFQPDRLKKEKIFSFDIPFEEHFLETEPGIAINYLHFKTSKPSKGLVLYFHGNADNLERWGKYQLDFVERGYDVIIPDYRGYGKSDGWVSEDLTYKDMHVLHKEVMKSLAPKELIIYGRSLGCGVATNLAKDVPAKYVILETPFYSIPTVFTDQLQIIWLPFELRYEFPNYANIPKIKYPVYIFHGTKDLVVPYRNAVKLKDVLKKEDTFVTIEEGTHRNLSTFKIYQEELDKLLGAK